MKRLWFSPPEIPGGPYITVYRSIFTVENDRTVSFDFSADERAQIFLDGKRLIDGPERGAPEYWYLQNVSFPALKGSHILTVRVLSLGFHNWSYGQLSVRHGFWIDEKSDILGNWECQLESGCTFETPFPDWGTFPRVHLTSEYNPQILEGKGGVWQKPLLFEDDRILHQPDLPLMRYDRVVPLDKGNGLFYFPDYVCAWGEYRFSGQGTVKIRWMETPYQTPEFDADYLTGNKGKRDGRYFVGNFDTFEINGTLHWFDYWWHAGHYVQIITEGDVKCTPEFYRTGYPYENFTPGNTLEKMAFDTLQACSFETYMDCPYYEQLMYIGDSRLEAICTRLITKDDRLIRKALRILSLSQAPDGSLNSQYPSRSIQKIPSFMLIWILMLHDHFQVNGMDGLTIELLPAAEKILKYFASQEKDGLVSIPGWNFIDWCKGWERGAPPGSEPNSILNFFYLMALQAVAQISGVKKYQIKAENLYARIKTVFFDNSAALYAIDPEHKFFSEHANVLALLAAGPQPEIIAALRSADDLTPCSIYFSYYYLEACMKCKMDDMAEKRLALWQKLPDEGLTTFPEEFVNPRSDCHAWGCYILKYLLQKQKK
ncbi:MAG: hypothetical protein J6W00_04400 [Lentisphaeria bacterium]|nr:hypothetical protein [Lentisphaeria bacterium]